MVTYRIDRINKEFLRAISEILQVRIKKDTVRDAILTKVSTSKDLSFAKVFYTLIDTDRKDEIQKALDSTAGQIRSMLGKDMHLRTIPELHFVFDDSEAKARAMEELLDKVAAMDAEKRSSGEN
ncbi:30S ribosome-binding factor [bioreactor metagenome]|jgi:ribosome-binding factor A|uniref:30S ribosome-binding factor n=1 Tax=bioreactor metagenome TaxID=1076179 RepID=A0A645DDT9_9ZZZZ|nr:30S ribosome-binding factor RbfA [Synergistaceae bacterium]MDD2351131.1 30S ribosome-binding factor RbfA [Synergistaceae bacterium]MDD3319393.1 30S ribosome-binding factor RbfA [Synergistaceae bacterium]MDD3672605.1 30S ribosome-binding factor RbfA [Synergistaceae bacterium]MDD3964096.1 30S ribosome-binding factor RbfA [Synergistaceae bacterium]